VSAARDNNQYLGSLKLLAGFSLSLRGGEQLIPFRMQRLIALVALLGRPSRLSVAGQLWSNVSDARALGNLRAVLHRLQASCPDVICSAGGALWVNEFIWVDVREVTSWALRLLSGDAGTEEELHPPSDAYSGELLPGWYEDWVLLEQEQFRQLRLHALEALADRLAGCGCFGEALYAAHCALRADPLRESAHRAIIRIHIAEGNLVEAARRYRNYRELLWTEVGAEPTPLMRGLTDGLPEVGHLSQPGSPLTARREGNTDVTFM
jgi:DNA-binding SARP family transcriptional activator